MGDNVGVWKVAATRIEAALLIQPEWKARLVEGELGQAVRFERMDVHYEMEWTYPDGARGISGDVCTESFSPRAVRDDFIALRSAEDALLFFGKYGPFAFQENWRGRYGPDSESRYEEEMGAPPDWPLSALPEMQELCRQALRNPPKDWLPPSPPNKSTAEADHRAGETADVGIPRVRKLSRSELAEVNRQWRFWRDLGPLPLKRPMPGRPPYDTVTAYCVREALLTAYFLDVYTRERYRECERCQTPFLVKSERGQRFCKPVCGSKDRVKRSRAKKRAAEATGSSTP